MDPGLIETPDVTLWHIVSLDIALAPHLEIQVQTSHGNLEVQISYRHCWE